MSTTVNFGMFWQVYARQTIRLPDYINPDDDEEVKDYIRSIWDDIPLPENSSYILNSDEFDDDVLIINKN